VPEETNRKQTNKQASKGLHRRLELGDQPAADDKEKIANHAARRTTPSGIQGGCLNFLVAAAAEHADWRFVGEKCLVAFGGLPAWRHIDKII